LSPVAISKKNFELKILQLPYIVSISLWYSADALLPLRPGFVIPECRVSLLPAGKLRMKMKISVINSRLAAA